MYNPNEVARALLSCLVSISMIFRYEAYRSKSYQKIVSIFIIIFTSIVIISTLSRANIAALLLFWWLFFSLYKSSKSIIKVGLIIIIFSAIVVLGYEPPREQLFNAFNIFVDIFTHAKANLDVGVRARGWLAAKNIIKDNFWFGIGYSRSSYFMEIYGAIVYREGDPHNIAIHGGFLKWPHTAELYF